MNDKTLNNWISLAEYDLKTSKAMLDSGRYLYVAFTAQQSIEKLLKAYYLKTKNETPPYIHNLLRLIDYSQLESELQAEQIDFLTELNLYYIEARYTEDISELSKSTNKEKANYIFNKTTEFFEWLSQKISKI